MTRVKICGLSTLEAVEMAVNSRADYIGFVFATSRRQVSLARANELAKVVPETTKIVGVFVSPSLSELEEAIAKVPLDIVQIHGDFPENDLSKISVPVIRAIQIRDDETQLDSAADFLLFDAPTAGSGQTFDWHLLAEKEIRKPFFIAGGLTAENVTEAQALFQPYAVDVSSGVETNGIKDLDKIRQFIERVKK
ncbi:MAG: phosphoribosylanthranilate isomerase [Streptococcus orisratti]|uniref:phosphoribosylanthranilate isomerase n=1 Tax=Streptococcus orisratti TaxID=114652 RepID=UPI0023567CE1|nr:phosphoribosylanthranilate isomerase [Streptococcus orisratti]MCI7678344.1 phosphoribosylanthranilate isomerase [Streptococcus orisratti]